ncbi:aminotransferase class IV [Aquincola sp. S2]|uniref:branched-chain-amino-acid transaminase n=1 Tax=Pseudaquabacterium terrae TaxID=2732868 RepID=A0ABX2EG28_9BURK|nr:aminotransferase class IV [Aquabacterium terrae]NRF67589.1 aminotransferase class IV [Aquabacterium terrae]
MPLPTAPATAAFEGGCAFADGAYVPLSEAKISLFDWGFTRSDATYDVVSVWQGAFFRLDDHLTRFFASLDKMRLQIPHTRAELREILHGCVRAGGLQDAYVAMVCTRGVPPRGARDPRLAQNRFYAYAVPFVWIASREKQREGIDLHISLRQRIAPASVDPTVKNYHWIDLVQSLFDAYDRGRDTSCVVDADGHVAEGPGFNVFMVKDGTVHTAASGVLEGVSRRTAIELCERLGLPLRIAPVPVEAMRAADEVFLTSTGGGVLPIAKLDGVPLPQFPGPVTSRLIDAYWAMHDEAAYRDPVDYRA